jgi:hypothetical protein
MEFFTRFGSAVYYMFTNPEPSQIAAQVMITVLVLVILSVALWAIITQIVQKSNKDPIVADSNVKQQTSLRIAALDQVNYDNQRSMFSDLINQLAPNERFLVNLCPLTASLGGYIGPVKEGVFNAPYYLRKALRAGIRSFVLPISIYYDDNKQPPNWPKARSPAIVTRDGEGKVISLNGLSIERFCSLLTQYRSLNAAQIEDPILIYLHAVEGYTPDPVADEKAYVKFMSDIARELKPLDPFCVKTLGPYGSAVGGKRANEILTQTPLTDLRNKVLIFTNFDVDIGTKDAYASMTPRLFDYANFVYKPVGAADLATAGSLGARSVRLGDVKGSKVDWRSQARINWHVTLQDSLLNLPDAEAVDAVTKTGIQAIPIPFLFTADPRGTDMIKPILDQWGGYAFRLKEPGARYAQPSPVVPQTPSTKLNARVAPNMQPGQLAVA